MTLAYGTDRLESARLVLRRITPDDLPFFTRLHALPDVARHLYPEGRPRSPEETATWLQYTLTSYEELALGYLAVLRKEDGALIGRCGLMDLVVEPTEPAHGIRKGWFGRERAPAGLALTFECELGYTLDPAAWGQGLATEAACCVRDYAHDVLRLVRDLGHSSPERSLAPRRRTIWCAPGRSNGCRRSHVGSLDVAARERWGDSAPADSNDNFATRRDISMNPTKGLVVPASGGQHLDMGAPGRFATLKLLGHETNESIMLFEETIPAGTRSLFHLHRDSDEVAWVLAGEVTFQIGDEVSVGGPGTCAFFPRNVPHAWKASSSGAGRVLFLYTPAAAGGYIEELLHRSGPMSAEDRGTLRERYRWEVVGPNPL